MINVKIGQGKKLIGEAAFLNFDYDERLITFLQIYPEKHYDPKTKTWEIQSSDLPSLIKANRKNSFKISYDKKATSVKVFNNKIPSDFAFKLKPFSHQKQAIEFALNTPKFLLADEQGLGKTKSCIDAETIRVHNGGAGKCLILCGINGSKWNWEKEVKTNSNLTACVLGSRVNKNGRAVVGSTKDKIEDLMNPAHFLITNMETLRDEQFLKNVQALLKSGYLQTVIFDEIHRCGNPQSQQGKGLLSLSAPNMVAISGTPILNSPMDAFSVLKWLGKETHSMTAFKKHYCIMGGFGGNEILGYKNMSELKGRIQEIELRRLKVDCLDLPPKVHTDELLEMSATQRKVYNEVLMDLRANIDKIKLSPNPLTQILRLRQATGWTGILSSGLRDSVKFDRAEQILDEVSQNGGKCLIFSNWVEVLNPFIERLQKYNPVIMTGQFKKDVVGQINKFQNDPKCKVCIGTIGFMGTAHTLTAANTVIFLDEPWNKGTKEQAEDRAHRIGTKGTTNIITLRCKNTVDERVAKIIETKGMFADFLVDGKTVSKDRSSLVEFLLS